MRPAALVIAGIICGCFMLAAIALAWWNLNEWGTGQRLGMIGVIIGMGWLGGKCFQWSAEKRA